MRRFQKSKRVSWASDVNLCQVKLFLSEDVPSLCGLGAQEHIQAKSWPLYSARAGIENNLPSGFKETHPANVFHNKFAQISVIRWQCPPKFVFDPVWEVVAGEESNEVDSQNQREMRVLEAVYPRASAIPPNPSLLMSQEDSHGSNQHTPLIPITPIEDDETAADTLLDNIPPNTVPTSSQCQISAPVVPAFQPTYANNPNTIAKFVPPAATAFGVEPEIVTAVCTALSTVIANNDQVNLIDPDLLVKILGDPNIIQKLASSHAASSNPQNMPKPRSESNTFPNAPEARINRTPAVVTSYTSTPRIPFYSPVSRPELVPSLRLPPPDNVLTVPPPPDNVLTVPPPRAPVVKDINYYKSLIQQHGSEKQHTHFDNPNGQLRPSHEQAINLSSSDLKPKIMKPCVYFLSSRGCRNGANCVYQHDVSLKQKPSIVPDMQSAKKIKLNTEITGVHTAHIGMMYR